MNENACAEIRPLLADLCAGETDGEQTARIRAHLDVCPACRAEWEAEQALTQALRRTADALEAEAGDPPPSLVRDVQSAVRADRRRTLRRRYGSLLAAACLLLAVGLTLPWIHLFGGAAEADDAAPEMAGPLYSEVADEDVKDDGYFLYTVEMPTYDDVLADNSSTATETDGEDRKGFWSWLFPSREDAAQTNSTAGNPGNGAAVSLQILPDDSLRQGNGCTVRLPDGSLRPGEAAWSEDGSTLTLRLPATDGLPAAETVFARVNGVLSYRSGDRFWESEDE